MSLKKNDCVGSGNKSIVYKVGLSIVVKAVRDQSSKAEGQHPFLREIDFYKRLNQQQDRCPNIIECFLALPDHLFLSYCNLNRIQLRFAEYQHRQADSNGFPGRLIRVDQYEDPALIGRWIQQVTSALEYIEKMGFSHNDLHPRNCLLDDNLNLKLCDFDRTTTIGQYLEGVFAPWARKLADGPLKGSYGLCSARTEQFAVGTLLYFMVYGHEPYEDIDLAKQNPGELSHRFEHMQFPKLDRDQVFDGLISACWYNVYPTMALVAYDVKRKTRDIALNPSYKVIDCRREKKTCEMLIQNGLLGPELARRFQPAWRRYLHAILGKSASFWRSLVDLLGNLFWIRF
ncbi:hypothetical protein FQN49_002102 [Arthroderma sp. PD_2]|nr:hypothetical protein FQN49_002102 [Arthroderma sp. PD_2]